MKKAIRIPLAGAALTGILMTSGCATAPNGNVHTGQGAAIGAVAGGVLGNVVAGSGGRTMGTLIGSAIGATVGGVVGHQMDKQEAQLRNGLDGTDITINREGDTLRLSAPESVTFDTGNAEISPSFEHSLDQIALSLRQNPSTFVRVEGHTDSRGSAQSNQALSVQRAEAVTSYLARRGVSPQRLQPVGYGESRPVAPNDTDSGRAENRRVEILIVPESA